MRIIENKSFLSILCKELFRKNPQSTISWGISIGIVITVSLIFYIILREHNEHSLKIFLTVLLICSGFSGLIWHMVKKTYSNTKQKIDFFSPYIFFPIVYSIIYGLGALEFTDSEQTIPLSQYSFYFIGLFSYFTGIIATRIIWMNPIKDSHFKKNWVLSRLLNVIAILMLISLLSTMYIILKTKLPIFTGPSIENLRTEFVHITGGYIYYFFRSVEIALILFFVYVFLQQKSIFTDPWKLFFLIISLFFLFSLAARRIIAVPLLIGILIYHYTRKRINLVKFFVLGICTFLLIVLIGYFRYVGTFQIKEEFIASRLSHEINLRSSLLHKTTEVFPKQNNFLGWKGFIQPFKAILPGTQKSLGIILKEDFMEMDFRGGGFMPTIVGGFYINFGLWGILVGMFLCGVVSKYLYLNILKRKDEFSIILHSYVSIYLISTIPGMVLGEIWPIYVIFILFFTNIYCRKKHN